MDLKVLEDLNNSDIETHGDTGSPCVCMQKNDVPSLTEGSSIVRHDFAALSVR
jgi:hypothetical protein